MSISVTLYFHCKNASVNSLQSYNVPTKPAGYQLLNERYGLSGYLLTLLIYNGAIITQCWKCTHCLPTSFNSSMVRLILVLAAQPLPTIWCFNSSMVRL